MSVNFGQPIDGLITAYAQAPNGDIYIGGNFSGIASSNILKFNSDGTVRDTNFNPAGSPPSSLGFGNVGSIPVLVVNGTTNLDLSTGGPAPVLADMPYFGDLPPGPIFAIAGYIPDVRNTPGQGFPYFCVPGRTAWTNEPFTAGTPGEYSFYVGILVNPGFEGNVTDPTLGRMMVNPSPYSFTAVSFP